jgi:hypothetical protein
MSYALFALVVLIVGGFVWALISTSMLVTYAAISCLTVVGIAFLVTVCRPHTHE